MTYAYRSEVAWMQAKVAGDPPEESKFDGENQGCSMSLSLNQSTDPINLDMNVTWNRLPGTATSV